MNTEDIWAGIQGPTSLVELAIDQKEANCELVEHHYSLCVMLHAVFTFSMRGVKLLSFFDSKVICGSLQAFSHQSFFRRWKKSPVVSLHSPAFAVQMQRALANAASTTQAQRGYFIQSHSSKPWCEKAFSLLGSERTAAYVVFLPLSV